MNLLLDLGNTRCKWQMGEAAGIATTLSELASQWASLPAPKCIFACAVGSPELQSGISTLAQSRWQQPIQWLRASAQACGVRNGYAQPEQLGADRWAAALGAHALYPDQDLIIVSAGTALVIDALSASGEFLGGMILPGYRLMKEALHQKTARLPLADGHFSPFPDNTDDAIETGCLSALCGAILVMQARLPNAEIIIFGGDAERIAPFLNTPLRVVDNLALRGLHAFAKENTQ